VPIIVLSIKQTWLNNRDSRSGRGNVDNGGHNTVGCSLKILLVLFGWASFGPMGWKADGRHGGSRGLSVYVMGGGGN
jgi:hypothetical protein